jgi:uncharacterized protein CbrC (UPF0167 family)
MKRFPNPLFLSAVVVSAASCGYVAPYTSSGPSLSKEGVEIAIAGESCYVNRSAEQFPTTVDDDQLNLALRLQIKNKSSHVAVLTPDHVGLSETLAGERMVMHPRESGAISLQPGETQTISLNFEQSGALDCHHHLALEAAGAVEIDGGKVSFEPIRFLASR